jgi:parallel beta-helix repeat protein
MRPSPSTGLWILFLGFFLFLFSFPASAAPNVWVAKDTSVTLGGQTIQQPGLDTNAGTAADTPVRTLTRALQIAGPDSTVYVAPGVYGETLTINHPGLEIMGSGKRKTVIKDTSPAPDLPFGVKLDTGNVTLNQIGVAGFQDYGIRSDTTNGNFLNNLRITNIGNGSGVGLRFLDTDGSTITNVLVRNSSGDGISFTGSSQNLLRNVTSRKNGGNGYVFNGGSSNKILSSHSDTNALNGLSFTGSSSNLLRKVTSRNNGGDGYDFNGGNNNRILQSHSRSNTQNGYLFSNSDTPYLRLLTSDNNDAKGYAFDSVGAISFLHSSAINNDGDELHLYGSNVSVDSIKKINFLTSSTSDILNESGDSITLVRSWYGKTDETIIQARFASGDGIDFKPYRLAPIDTDPLADTVAPKTPTGITADTSQPKRVHLEWNQVNQNEVPWGNFDKSVYRIYRSQNPNITNWKSRAIAEVDQNDTDFVDTGITPGTTYYYRVTTVDSPQGGDAQTYENESFFSTIEQATPITYRSEIYVNDGSTANDQFTANQGNDSNVGTPQHPLRTLDRAAEVAKPGSTIYVDDGLYTDTAVLDTSGVTVRGAGTNRTIFDVNGSDTAIKLTQTAGDTTIKLRDFTVRNASTGIAFAGSTRSSHLLNVVLHGNTTGIMVTGTSTNNVISNNLVTNNQTGIQLNGNGSNRVTQNQFTSNTAYQLIVNQPNGIRRNNIIPSSMNPDSGVRNAVGSSLDLTFNWWTSTDSSIIRTKQTSIGNYIPHRLGKMDTGVGADSVAPSEPPNPAIDTSVPGQITLDWDVPTTDEDGSSLSGSIEGYRIYRISNAEDTSNWNQNLYETIGNASDTNFTDTQIIKDEQYSYRLTAVDEHTPENESYFTDILSGTWVNRVPVADSLTLETQVDSAVSFRLSGSDPDGDTLTYHIDDESNGDSLTLPRNGSLDTSAFSPTNPELTYEPDSGIAGIDTFTYIVSDGDTVSDTAVVTINVLIQTNVNATSFQVEGADTPIRAASGGTIPVRMVFTNTETGSGVVQLDTQALRIHDLFNNDIRDSFSVSISDSTVRIPGNDTGVGEWGISVPASGQSDLFGNLAISFDLNTMRVRNPLNETFLTLGDSLTRKRETINILPPAIEVDHSEPAAGIDTIPATVQSVSLDGGINDGDTVLATSNLPGGASLDDGDSVIRMIQRGGTTTIDTPFANPDYNFSDASGFDQSMRNAYDALENQDLGRNLKILPNNLLLISLWRNNPRFGTYLGDSTVLREPMTVTVGNVNFTGQTERLKVIKLLPESSSWTWHTVDELNDPGDVSGSPGNYTVQFTVRADSTVRGSGFSVFQIISSGVVKTGDASEAVVYPNPFVPTDNEDGNGCYSGCPSPGIYFGAGNDRGFPAGTELKLYTIKGEMIDAFTLSTGGIFQWDARTMSGQQVASGVYIYRIVTPDGEQKVGKFAIVR